MTGEARTVATHYRRGDLMQRIAAALEAAGVDPASPTRVALRALDHLHGGGFQATVAQVEMAAIPRGCHALDAGCGIGGPSRYLADALDCSVEAVDLTPDFVEVAQRLNALVGLDDRISVSVASVTELPFDDGRFDAVLCQNVSMNVEDKAAMFAEALRVLKPGGIYTLSHVASGPKGDPIYPLPWARTPDISFLGTAGQVIDTLAAAGFVGIEARIAPPPALRDALPPGAAAAAPAMGDDLRKRVLNSMRSHAERRLLSLLIAARRPA
jgi:SAM-dependent methyltransferase